MSSLMPFEIEKIYLDEQAAEDRIAQAVLKSLPHLPVERVTDKKTLIKAKGESIIVPMHREAATSTRPTATSINILK